ncbi:hypothetical protein GCM10023317_61090 [Actinopolymorpha pittospori]
MQVGAPVAAALGQRDLGDGGVQHQIRQPVLAADVPIERHRGVGAESSADVETYDGFIRVPVSVTPVFVTAEEQLAES